MSEEKVNVPDGFDINAGRTMGDGWMKKEKGNVCQGKLLGRFGLPDDDRFFYQVLLNKPCKVLSGKGEETKEVVLEAGQIANVDESKALEGLSKYTKLMDYGGVYEAWIMYGDKIKLDGGNTFWPVVNGPRVKQLKAPKDVPF